MRAGPFALLSWLSVLVLVAGCLSEPKAPPVVDDGWAVVESRLTPDDMSAAEVAVAVSPVDPRLHVAAANSGGGFGIYRSEDGGRNWTASWLAPVAVSEMAGPAHRYNTLSDPVPAFGPDGACYVAGLAYLPLSAVFVATSTDGCATWDAVSIVEESDIASSFNDKEWLAVAPDGTLFVTWQKELVLDQLRSVESTVGLDVDTGDIVVARSTDGGATWTEPAIVSRGMHNNGTQVGIDASGRAYLLWVNYEVPSLDFSFSDDGGVTWSPAAEAVGIDFSPSLDRYARMHTLPALAVAPNGTLHAVWHDERNGDLDVYAVMSPDGGTSWTEAVRVPAGAPGDGVHQLFPWAAVGPDGRLHVTFYDAQADPEEPRFRYAWTHAAPGTLDFAPVVPVGGEPFAAFVGQDGSTATSRSFGDYTGVVAGPEGIVAVWTDGRGDGTAVHAARLPAEGVTADLPGFQ